MKTEKKSETHTMKSSWIWDDDSERQAYTHSLFSVCYVCVVLNVHICTMHMHKHSLSQVMLSGSLSKVTDCFKIKNYTKQQTRNKKLIP